MEEPIQKINLNESGPVKPEVVQDGSILIPKINVPESKLVKEMTKNPKKRKIFRFLLTAIVIILVVFAVSALLLANVYKKAMIVKADATEFKTAFEAQNIAQIKEKSSKLKKSLGGLKTSYRTVAWMKVVPFVGAYISDGSHGINFAQYALESSEVGLNVIEPYADIIGFSDGGKPTSGEETAKDRIDFIVKTIPEVIPKSDDLIKKVTLAQKEINYINPDRYPETFQGKKVRETLKKGIDTFNTAADLVEKSKPLLEVSPYLMGANGPRTYMVIFQNDKELRPTGGFITAYTIAKVDKGKFEPIKSDDIYNLDSGYTPSIAAPEQFAKYLKGIYVASPRYRLRDMNWNPDYEESMKTFSEEIKKVGINNIDGIIAVDTQFLVNILDVLGNVGVGGGYGEFNTKIVDKCKCPQVIYELESFADIEGAVVWSENEPGKIVFAPKNYGTDNRKKIIGPLMNSILANVLGQPKEKIPDLMNAVMKSLTEKHIIFYLNDPKAQEAVEKFGIAGKIDAYEGDYLYINDANLGGRKSNLYVKKEVAQKVTVSKDGSLEKELTISYANPEKQDGWLNSVLPNWVRIYVPKGSQLVSFQGVEEQIKPYDESGKTVFAGFFNLRPQGSAKLTLKYKLPNKLKKNEYDLLIQKQPGTMTFPYTVSLGKKNEEFLLSTDKIVKLQVR